MFNVERSFMTLLFQLTFQVTWPNPYRQAFFRAAPNGKPRSSLLRPLLAINFETPLHNQRTGC
jgi:hypothetical protein